MAGLLVLPLAGTAAPTLLIGDQSVETNADSNVSGTVEAFQATAAASGIVGDIRVYVDTSPPTKLAAGLYANNAGHPGTMLAQGTFTTPVGGAWNDVQLTSSASVTAGTVYWIAVLAPSGTGTLRFRDRAGAGSSETGGTTGLAALPSSWKTGTHYTDGPISAYALASADTTPPTAPATPSASSTTATSVSLSWGASSDNVGVSGYSVYSNGTKAGSTAGTSYTVGGLTCATAYTFGVEAYDAAGNISPRSTATLSTAACPDTTAPTAPSGLAVGSSSTTSVSLSWAASTDNVAVSGYSIYANGTKNGSTASTGYTAGGLACGTSYTFGVEAYDAAGNVSARSTVVGTTATCPDTSPPTAPGSPTSSAVTTSSFTIAWNASSDDVGVAGYSVYLNGQKAGSTSATTYSFSGLACGATYTVGLEAFDAAGNVSGRTTTNVPTAACPDTMPPSQPGGFAVSSTTSSTISTTWAAATDNVGVAGYDVYVGTQPVGTTTSASFTFGGFSCGQAFTLGVDAYDAAGNVSSRATLTASTAPCPDANPPSPPSAFTATSSTATSIATTWTASTDDVGVTGYFLYVNGSSVGTTTTTGYTFSGLACATTFALGVEAYDAAGNVSSRTTASAATGACADTTAPTAPSGLIVTGSTATSIGVMWDASSDDVGVSGYDLFAGAQRVTTTSGTSYTFTGLSCGQLYTLGVDAFDAAGNVSQRATITAASASCPDTSAPTAPSRFASGGSTATTVSTSWTASTDNVGVAGYSLYVNSQKIGTTTATSYVFSGLTCATTYSLGVEAFDAAGNVSQRSTLTAATAACPDTTPPTVTLTAPAAGATVSGGATLTATASDNIGVASVQFTVDGTKVGPALTTSPYSYSWDSRTVGNGTHTIKATATDAAGNAATTGGTTVTVSNSVSGAVVIGDQKVESSDSNPAGISEAFRTTATGSGSVTVLKVYVAANAPSKLVAGIYGDAAGHPGTLLGQGTFTSPAGGAWSSVALTTAVPVTSGTAYWLAILSPSGTGTLRFADRGGTGTAETYAANGLTTLPSSWRTGSRYSDGSLSAYGVAGADTTAPTAPTGLTVGVATGNTLTLTWAASSDDVGVAGYHVFLNGTNVGAPTGTSYTYSGLACGSTYTLGVEAFDAAGNVSPRTQTQGTTVACDGVPPTVALTSPTDGSSVTGQVTLSADASDDVAVASVQFQVDGVNVGPPLTAQPYTTTWDTRTVSNATHSVTAVARDTAGNTTRSAAAGVTVSNALDGSNAFKAVDVGPGYVDASVRQVIRTADDRVYIFASDDTPERQGTGPGVIRAWRATTVGIPTAFTEVDGAHRPTANATSHIIASPDVRLDRNGIVQLLYVSMTGTTGNLVYQTFDPSTDTWGATQIVDTGVRVPPGSIPREPEDTIVLDSQEAIQAVYVKGSSLLYRTLSGGSWSAPTTVASGGTLLHPTLAAAPDGSLHLAWLSDGTSPSIWYAEKPVAGQWTAPEAVATTDVLSNSNMDQTPSIVVTSDGVPYVNYISAVQTTNAGQPFGAVRVRHRVAAGQWADDTPSTQFYTHTPQIYSRGQDLYVFLGHDINFNMGYIDRLAGQPWSAFNRLTTFSADGSASVRWDPARDNDPAVIDEADFDEDRQHDHTFLPELYYIAVLPS